MIVMTMAIVDQAGAPAELGTLRAKPPAREGPKRERVDGEPTLRECSERWPQVPLVWRQREPGGASF